MESELTLFTFLLHVIYFIFNFDYYILFKFFEFLLCFYFIAYSPFFNITCKMSVPLLKSPLMLFF